MRSTTEWLYWGKRDPLWAVMTDKGRQIDGDNPWTGDDFLAHGAKDLKDTLSQWDHYGRTGEGTCVEIGCGAGRMTTGLSRVFDRVFAIDVSPDQIATAKRFLGTDADQVEFSLVDRAEIRLQNDSCVGMFSSHVFQHLPSLLDIEAYLAETHRVLKQGGTICFHLPVPGDNRPERPWWREKAQSLRIELLRRIGNLAVMEHHEYATSRVMSALKNIGYRDIQLRIFQMTTSGLFQSHFFARK